jgi:hypothetical protein
MNSKILWPLLYRQHYKQYLFHLISYYPPHTPPALQFVRTSVGIRIRSIRMFWASRIRIRIQWSEVRIRIRILPFSHKCVERTEIRLQNNILTQTFSRKFFKTEDVVPVGKLWEKNVKNNHFLHPQNQWRKESDPLVRGTDPGIWIRIRT